MRVFNDCSLPVHCVSFSPDGKYLAAAGDETTVRIFDLAGGMHLTELENHSAVINSISWNANSNKLASCCADGTLRVFNINATDEPYVIPFLSLICYLKPSLNMN